MRKIQTTNFEGTAYEICDNMVSFTAHGTKAEIPEC